MPKWIHAYGTIELAMRVYAYVENCSAVQARKREMALHIGEHMQIAREVAREFGCCRSQAARHVRVALDLLGFGEPVRERTHCGLKKPGTRWKPLDISRKPAEARA